MPLSSDILRTWRDPRGVMRDLMRGGPREDRLIFVVMFGCFMMFVAQLPVQARLAHLSRQGSGDVLEMDMLIGTTFFGWLMIMPLLLYLVAGLSVAIMRVLGRPVSGHDARLALFWAVLAAAPAALLAGLANGLVGPGATTRVAGVVWIGALLLFWMQGLREAVVVGRERVV
jgi:hypothetical protein